MRTFARPLAALPLLLALAAGLAAQPGPFPVAKTKAELETVLAEQAGRIDGRVGLYARHVESGETVGLRDGERFQLASVFKIPVLMTLHKQVRLGRVSLDDRILFEERMKTYGSGLMGDMKPGLAISVQDLQLLMMARSDNTATDILYHLVTPEAIAATLAECGIKDTTIDYDTRELILAYLGLDPANRLTPAELGLLPPSTWTDPKVQAAAKAFDTSLHNTSTPRDIGTLLEKCVKGEFVDRATSDRVLETMKSHTGAEIVLRYLPMATDVARKGGSLSRGGENTVLLDAAVIWLPDQAGTLVLCLFGNDIREVHYELKHKLGLMARAAYDYFLQKNKRPAKG